MGYEDRPWEWVTVKLRVEDVERFLKLWEPDASATRIIAALANAVDDAPHSELCDCPRCEVRE